MTSKVVGSIDISSSDTDDSDLKEIDNYRDDSPLRDSASSIKDGIFTSQPSSSHTNSPGRYGFSREDPSSSSSPALEIFPSSSSRMLPSWAASPQPNPTGKNGNSRKDPSSKRPIGHDEANSRVPSLSSVCVCSLLH